MCYDQGILQAYLDHQLESTLRWEITRHLERCTNCRRILEELRSNDLLMQQCLSLYPADVAPTVPVAGNHLHVVPEGRRSKIIKLMGRKFGFMNKYKKVAAVAAMVAVLFTAFSFPAVRSMASEFLTIFRVESVQTINISNADIQALDKAFQEGAGEVNIENFGQIEVTGKPESIPVSQAEAAGAVDFDLKLPHPAGYSEPALMKTTGHTVQLTLAVEPINAMLKALGSTQMLPADLDGQTISMDIPTAIMATYQNEGAKLFVAQARSPELKSSAGIDVNVIRDALLGIPALPDNLRNQLLAVNDLKHTLLIPNVDGSSREVAVNGTTGVLIADSHGETSAQSLVWQQKGVVYVVGGTSLDLDSALAIAAQMK